MGLKIVHICVINYTYNDTLKIIKHILNPITDSCSLHDRRQVHKVWLNLGNEWPRSFRGPPDFLGIKIAQSY